MTLRDGSVSNAIDLTRGAERLAKRSSREARSRVGLSATRRRSRRRDTMDLPLVKGAYLVQRKHATPLRGWKILYKVACRRQINGETRQQQQHRHRHSCPSTAASPASPLSLQGFQRFLFSPASAINDALHPFGLRTRVRFALRNMRSRRSSSVAAHRGSSGQLQHSYEQGLLVRRVRHHHRL